MVNVHLRRQSHANINTHTLPPKGAPARHRAMPIMFLMKDNLPLTPGKACRAVKGAGVGTGKGRGRGEDATVQAGTVRIEAVRRGRDSGRKGKRERERDDAATTILRGTLLSKGSGSPAATADADLGAFQG